MRNCFCLQLLQRDCRTIIGTGSFSPNVIKMALGEYCHTELDNTLSQELRHQSKIPTVFEHDLHADGVCAVNVGKMEYLLL